MAPKFDSKRSGVVITDDQGKVLGTAPHHLNSDDALAHLGYEADAEAASGVRRIGATAAPAAAKAKPAVKRGR